MGRLGSQSGCGVVSLDSTYKWSDSTIRVGYLDGPFRFGGDAVIRISVRYVWLEVNRQLFKSLCASCHECIITGETYEYMARQL